MWYIGAMNLCIFEDEKYVNFYPLTLSRPVFELRTGTRSLREKLLHFFPANKIFILTRPYLEDILMEGLKNISFEIPKEPTLFINGRVIPTQSLENSITFRGEEILFFNNETLIAAHVKNGKSFEARLRKKNFEGYKREEIDAKIVNYPWELVNQNGSEIEKEFNLFGNSIPPQRDVTMLRKEHIFIGENVVIMPGVVIDADEGPVIIDNGARIMPNCYLEGPLYIGKNSLIKAGARIYSASSIGNICKVGGELETSIFHGYSNKQHEGFIGHSYIGEWVNIGADTNNSDLKNNYKEVTVYINNKPVNTELTFVGSFIGDHSKTAINTMLNTGTVIGFSSNIFGEGFPLKFVPSFSWGGRRRLSIYKIEKAIETARLVMARRKVKMSDAYERMMEQIFEETKKERNNGT